MDLCKATARTGRAVSPLSFVFCTYTLYICFLKNVTLEFSRKNKTTPSDTPLVGGECVLLLTFYITGQEIRERKERYNAFVLWEGYYNCGGLKSHYRQP